MSLTEYIKNTFPLIEEIESDDLKNKVIEVYCKALMEGGWDDLEGIPFTKTVRTDVSYITHVKVVTDMALKAADTLMDLGIKLDRDWIIIGGLLHDIGKLFEYSDLQSHEGLVRHPFSGVGLAMSAGLPPQVCHIIAMHAKEGDLGKRIAEAVIIHHCDFMHFEIIKANSAPGT